MSNATHAIVVGGTRGIGRVIAGRLAADGHRVSALGRRGDPGSSLAVPGVDYVAADLLDTASMDRAAEEMLPRHGNPGILVFSQRFRGSGDSWTGEVDTSLQATRSLIDRLSDRFDSKVPGSIVIMTSVASTVIAEEQPLSYHIGKGALDQLIRYYAVSLGGKGIRVNGIAPGLVLKEESKEFILKDASLVEQYRSLTPLGRMGTSEDIAGVASFLCSPDAAFLTGQILTVDGGLSLRTHESVIRLARNPKEHLRSKDQRAPS